MSTAEGGGNIVTDGLILYLDAANTKSIVSGSTTWVDISRGGNNGILTNGPTFNSGNGGNIVFDGVNDFCNLGTSNSTTFPSDFSLNCWVKIFGNVTPFGSGVISKRNPGTFQSNYQLRFSSSRFTFGINGTSPNTVSLSGPLVMLNVWYNITCVRIGTIMRIYYNSVLENTTSTPAGSSSVSNTVLRIGQNHDLNAPLNGSIGLTQIYNRALTAQEVLQNYNATKGRYGL